MYTASGEAHAPSAHVMVLARNRGRVDTVALLLALATVGAVCFGQSVMKLFWYDELVTLHIAALPSLADIFHFYESGKDTTSFLPAMLVHVFQQLPGKLELTARAPFTFAYLVTCLCMWVFCYRRYAAGFATGAVLLFAQGMSLNFASEARAYAFVMMGAGIALVCWQNANRDGHSTALATWGVFLGLATALLFHFFAIFLFVPFAVAEWAHAHETGRLRKGMWAAIVLFPLAITIMLPTILNARRIYGKTFWSKPEIGALMGCYTDFMGPIGRDVAELALLIAVVLWFRSRTPGGAQAISANGSIGFTRPEWVLLLGVGLLPFCAFAGSKFLGLFRPQYVIYFEIGLVLLLVGGLAEVLHRSLNAGWAFAALMLVLLATHSRGFVVQATHQATGRPVMVLPNEYSRKWYEFIRPIPLPVVADGVIVLSPIEQYCPPDLRRRLFVLTSYRRSLTQPQSITTELNMEIFGKTLHYPVQDYDAFTAQHHDFLLVVSPYRLPYGWIYPYLLKESETKGDVQLKLIWADATGESSQIYLVHMCVPDLSQQGNLLAR